MTASVWRTRIASTSSSCRRRPSAAPSSTDATVDLATTSTWPTTAAWAASASASRSARRSYATDASQNVLYGTMSATRGRSVEMPDLLELIEAALLIRERDDHLF